MHERIQRLAQRGDIGKLRPRRARVSGAAVALGIAPAVMVGTSRGGLVTMELAAEHPQMIAGVVFNDIGPVVELSGLMRIKGYVGKMPQPADFRDGAAILEEALQKLKARRGES